MLGVVRTRMSGMLTRVLSAAHRMDDSSGISRSSRLRWRATLRLVCSAAAISWCTGCSSIPTSVYQKLPWASLAADSVAQANLRIAERAARGVYALTLPEAQNNFAGVYGTDSNVGGDAVDDTDLAAEQKAIESLSQQEPDISFVPWSSIGGAVESVMSGMAVGSRDDTTALSDARTAAEPDNSTIWVQMPYNTTATSHIVTIDSLNTGALSEDPLSDRLVDKIKANTRIRAGDVIRMGVVSTSGSSFCVIVVANSSNKSVSGVGYQSVSKEATVDGRGADCGAGSEGSDRFKEMPGTIGTDPYLREPVDFPASEAYGGVLTHVPELIVLQRDDT